METLKYKVITTEKQYNKYSKLLEELVFIEQKSNQVKDEIALLSLLINKWDEDHSIFGTLDPIELLKSLMKDHNLRSIHLAAILGVSEGLISDMLSYKKGMSKDTIRLLSKYFNLKQEVFNRPYHLMVPQKPKPRMSIQVSPRTFVAARR